jgi:hypothetical protein
MLGSRTELTDFTDSHHDVIRLRPNLVSASTGGCFSFADRDPSNWLKISVNWAEDDQLVLVHDGMHGTDINDT